MGGQLGTRPTAAQHTGKCRNVLLAHMHSKSAVQRRQKLGLLHRRIVTMKAPRVEANRLTLRGVHGFLLTTAFHKFLGQRANRYSATQTATAPWFSALEGGTARQGQAPLVTREETTSFRLRVYNPVLL